jgi:hypothetical protein
VPVTEARVQIQNVYYKSITLYSYINGENVLFTIWHHNVGLQFT